MSSVRLSQWQRTAAAVSAATVLNLPFGTLYAFSVFLKQLESQLGVGRTESSFVFAFATITLTVGMNFAPRLYRTIPPAALALGCGACSSAGLLLAASASGLAQFTLGYSVLYALGAGIAFTVSQQGVNQTVKGRSGLANGYTVSLYPLGAMIGAPVFGWIVETQGLRALLIALAVTVACASVVSAGLLRLAIIRMHDTSAAARKREDAQWPLFLRLAAVFFLAASAGLMVMSQAAGIVQAYGGATGLALGATTFITGAVAAARIGGGWLVDHYSVPRVALGAHLWSLAGGLALTIWPMPLTTLPALAMIGMGYGLVSGLTAAAIAQYWPKNVYGRVASLLYVAWCAAALSLPVLAGWLYDRSGGYRSAVLIAAGINVLGALVAAGLPSRARSA